MVLEAESPHTTPSARETDMRGKSPVLRGDDDRRERRDDEVQLAAAAVLYTQGEAGEADNLQRPIVVSPRSLAQEVQFDFGLSIMLVRATSNIELSRPLMVLFSEENTS